ncbi:MAG TPA: methionine biosynthesis protein MetW [Usitatibacter sp.]|jgi:methionine biosynthesis protein MetW|nr:methionine biosynthesis protein MetW [Usitatibacter sp.]
MMQRYDYELIASWIPERSRVLDLGCGDGVLLAGLAATHGAFGYGIEIDDANVLASVKHGVNVLQADIEGGLASFGDNSFDFVILSQTLQAMRDCDRVLNEMLRVGREGIVTFPNFGYWRHRLDIMRGHMPVSRTLPYSWYDTPNIHLCTVKDFEDLCVRVGAQILDERVIHGDNTIKVLPNLRGSTGVFRFRRK